MNEFGEVDGCQQYRVVARAIDYLQAHADQQPSLETLARAVHLSPHHLQRVFTRWAGVSPKRFLQYLTKQRAMRALQETDDLLSASEVTGLSSPGRLHDLMVSCEAMTPAEVRSAGAGVALSYGLAPTPFGEALLGWTARGVCYLAFVDEDRNSRMQELGTLWSGAQRSEDSAGALALVQRIFPTQGEPEPLHLLLRGTNFQVKVWEALLRCDSSRPISYSQLANRIGSPRSQRAVGSALAANTIGYLIPCHRVIRESGELGSYRWGVARKRVMLVWEEVERQSRS